MEIITYSEVFSSHGKHLYAKYVDSIGWGLYSAQPFYKGDVVLKLHVTLPIERKLQCGPTFDDCKFRNISIAPHVEWCPTDKHPFWNFNHSCNPNTGFIQWGRQIDGYIPIVAYHDIDRDTHLTFDYSTTTPLGEGTPDGLPWEMDNCFCGDVQCRRLISEFYTLPEALKWRIVTQPRDSVRYGGVFAYILHEDPALVSKLQVNLPDVYQDVQAVYADQVKFSQHFLLEMKP
jgi:hypothetical protein